MHTMKLFSIALVVVVIFALPATSSAQSSKTTVLTFSQPVEIPGMVLAPGTYAFKESSVDARIIQVWNATETRLYASLLTNPSYRADATNNAAVTLDEAAKGAPRAIKNWFSAGQNVGQEFVYGPSQAEGTK
jgi:hypothetical protein